MLLAFRLACLASLFIFSFLTSACMMHASIESLDKATLASSEVKIARKIYLDTTQLTITEGSAAIINVALSEKSDKDIQVNISLNDVQGSFQPVASSLTIPAQSLSRPVVLQSIEDTIYKGDQVITLTISSEDSEITADPNTLIINLNDNDQLPAISINDVTVIENAGSAVFTISLSQLAISNVNVNYATANATALSGTNYSITSGTATIPVGSSSITISVPIIDTATVCEGDRTFYVNLSTPVNGIIQDAQGVGTIQENDLPIVSVGNVSIVEGAIAPVPVTLNQACPVDVSFSYSMSDGTATSIDYVGTSSTFTVKAGKTLVYLGVPINEDSSVEGNENFTLNIFSPVNTTIGTASSTITIQDNDVTLAATNNVTQISAGPRVTCAIKGGGAFCWGGNGNGDLGNGTTTPSYIPVPVTGLSSGVSKIVNGGLFYIDSRYSARTCAIVSGAAKCWGYQSMGELGNNSTSSSSIPVDVVGLGSNVTDIDTSEVGYSGFTCGVHNGAAKCWGNNSVGQLGNGTTGGYSLVPVQVSGLTAGVVGIGVGENHACAVISDGTIKCWGNNSTGQLGDGTTTSSSVPVSVSGIASGATKVSLGYRHSCALVSGGIKCWGSNGSGQFGNGTTNSSLTPVDTTGMTSGIIDMSTTGDAVGGVCLTCAIDSLGAVKCWGQNNNGQLGDGTTTTRTLPTQVTGFSSGFVQVSAGVGTSCAVHSNGKSYCWGDFSVGQLSSNTAVNLFSPKDVLGLTSNVTAVSVGHNFSCGIHNGAAKCWGTNSFGQLGNGDYNSQGTAAQVSGLTSGVTSIATYFDNYYADRHTCAVHNGAVKCWGQNNYGQLGNGTTGGTSNIPVQVSGLTLGAVQVAVSLWHSCALLNNGTVKCWGLNSHGQLGNNSTTNSNIPVDVAGISSATFIATSSRNTCVIDAGAVKCWGLNSSGQIGDGTTTDRMSPTQVTGLTSGVTSLSMTAYDSTNAFACVVHNGAAKCWGYGYNGRLGTGNGSSQTSPTTVVGFSSGVKKISTNMYGGCLLTNEGSVSCWGENNFLMIAPSFGTSIYLTPSANAYLSAGVADIATGGNAVCVITNSGGLKCMGNAFNSGVGIVTNINPNPAEILFP